MLALTGWLVQSSRADAQDLRIEHATIVSPERWPALHDVTVTVRDGRIVDLSTGGLQESPSPREAGVQRLDASGLYLIPGLIDSHVHLGAIPGMTYEQERAHPDIAMLAWEQIPRSYLYFGFTTLIDLASTPEVVARWKSHNPSPDTYFCGAAAVMDGYPMNWVPKPQRYKAFPYMIVQKGEESAAPEGVSPAAHTPKAAVSRMKADGAICVKSFFHRYKGENLPVPRLQTMRALVSAAHSAGMPTILHAIGPEGQTLGLDAGVAILAHGLWEWSGEPQRPSDLTPEVKKVLDRVIQTHTGFQPTMQVVYGFRDLFNPAYLADPRMKSVLPVGLIAWYQSPEGQWFRTSIASGLLPDSLLHSSDAAAKWRSVQSSYAPVIQRNKNATRYLAQRNARLLFGTDTPAVPTYANPPGLNAWLEMRRLIEAGVTPAQLFRAMTSANAEALGLGRDIGTVEVGKRANLLLVRADPTQTIQAYAEIVKVILGGRVLDPGELAADRGR